MGEEAWAERKSIALSLVEEANTEAELSISR